ncbi:amino acid transporter [Neobacillus niacini]|uniref:amino acid transporter n=1 Tax=Neobacillus niacini TaxID=86668 RepID=UPI0030001DAA
MNNEKKAFNDVIDHYNKIEGNAANLAKTDFKKLPKPIRYIGFFMIGFFSISIILMIILNIFMD